MDSNISSRSSSPDPKPQKTAKISEPKTGRHAPRTDKQMAALKLGMAKLKEKRETLAKEKDDRKKTNEELKSKGLPPIEPPIKLKKTEVSVLPPVTLEPVKIEVKQRKSRVDKGTTRKDTEMKHITREEFDELKGLMSSAVKPVPVVAPAPAPAPVRERVVEPKVLSGSELLNKIFFNK